MAAPAVQGQPNQAGDSAAGESVVPAEAVDAEALDSDEIRAAGDGHVPGSCRDDIDRVGAARAVDRYDVSAGPAQDPIRTVTEVPLDRVVAGTENHPIGSSVAVDRVVSGSAVQDLGKRPAEQHVAAGPTVQSRPLGVRERPVPLVDPEAVVAASRVHDDPREPVPLEGEVGRPVVPYVDHEPPARIQPEAYPLARESSGHRQRAAVDGRLNRRLRSFRETETGREDHPDEQEAGSRRPATASRALDACPHPTSMIVLSSPLV